MIEIPDVFNPGKTGNAGFDRHISFVGWTISAHGIAEIMPVLRCCMAIIWKENAGVDHPAPYVGDMDSTRFPGGPSIGPMQVYRKSAIDYGVWRPNLSIGSHEDERTAYLKLANDEHLCLSFGVNIFLHKWREARGDFVDAIRRYNGGGVAAKAYAESAVAFGIETWGADFWKAKPRENSDGT